MLILDNSHSINLFEINENSKIHVDYIEKDVKNSKFYVIEDFFKYPDEIVQYLYQTPPSVWKVDDSPSYNTIYFEDLRHNIENVKDLTSVYDLLGNLSGQKSKTYGSINTNLFKFKSHDFNNYNKNYWYPHKDAGYTGLVYLNKDDLYNGTNIYKEIDYEMDDSYPEHYKPWVSKEKLDLLMTVPPKYNRMFFFNAHDYTHGMNIHDDKYSFDEYRMNLVFFFDIDE
jgi:hypothetical protein